MGCTITDRGAGDAQHHGHHVGKGVYFYRDERGAVTICQHQANDVRRPPILSLTLDAGAWGDTVNGMDNVPELSEPEPLTVTAPAPAAEAKPKKSKKGKKGAKKGRVKSTLTTTFTPEPAAPEPAAAIEA